MARGDDKSNARRRASADIAVATVRDIRRHVVTPVPTGKPGREVAETMSRTLFPNTVKTAFEAAFVLKDGANNVKLGGYVLVGPLKGARILSLTLEERATCPTSCKLWTACFGNGMPLAERLRHGPELLKWLSAELVDVCSRFEKVLIRLHVLGDFYSPEYLQFWADALDTFPGLHIFGFTAWPEDTKIGRGIAYLRDAEPARFAVRTSGRTGKWGSFTLPFPTEAKMIGDAVVCPEQSDAMNGGKKSVHCGSCGMCWKTGGAATGRPIAFVMH